MALTVAVGTDGACVLPTGHHAKIDRWEAAYGQRVINISGFDSAGDEENKGSMRFGGGSATGHFKYGASSTAPGTDVMAPAGSTITLTISTGCTIAHTAVVSNIAMSSDVNGEARVTFSFVKSGAITETWAVS